MWFMDARMIWHLIMTRWLRLRTTHVSMFLVVKMKMLSTLTPMLLSMMEAVILG